MVDLKSKAVELYPLRVVPYGISRVLEIEKCTQNKDTYIPECD